MLGDIKSIAWDGTGVALRQQGANMYRRGGSAVSTLADSDMLNAAATGNMCVRVHLIIGQSLLYWHFKPMRSPEKKKGKSRNSSIEKPTTDLT
jgi:hypothetical protein